MGCWNETCAISRLPIFPDQKCVMLVVRDSNIYDLISPTGARDIELLVHGTYNDYGWINEIADDPYEKEIHDDKLFVIFFREDMWNFVLDYAKKTKDPYKGRNLVKTKEDARINDLLDISLILKIKLENYLELLTVLCVLYRARINLCSYQFSGSQSAVISFHKELIKKMKTGIQEIESDKDRYLEW